MASYPSLVANLNAGYYMAFLNVDMATTGAGSIYYTSLCVGGSGPSGQTGFTAIDFNYGNAPLSGSNYSLYSFAQFQVTVPGPIALFSVSGSVAGWAIDGYASLFIVNLPDNATSLLVSRDLTLRSLAFSRLQKEAGTGKFLAEQIRQELGLPKKIDDEDALETQWKAYLKQQQPDEKERKKPLDVWHEEKEELTPMRFRNPIEGWDRIREHEYWKQEMDRDEKKVPPSRPSSLKV